MTAEVAGPAPPGNRPGNPVATKQLDNGILIPLTDPLDELARHIDGSFVLVVRVTGGKYRRRCFLTAASAERAARNAQDAGYNAEVFLAELKPLWRLSGRESVS